MTNDPIIEAIAAYRAGLAAFDAIDEADWPKLGGEMAVVWSTYGESYRTICNWERPALTREGAAEALKMALSEMSMFDDDESQMMLIKAALGYLEGPLGRLANSTSIGAGVVCLKRQIANQDHDGASDGGVE